MHFAVLRRKKNLTTPFFLDPDKALLSVMFFLRRLSAPPRAELLSPLGLVHYWMIMICHLDRLFYTLTGITHQQRSGKMFHSCLWARLKEKHRAQLLQSPPPRCGAGSYQHQLNVKIPFILRLSLYATGNRLVEYAARRACLRCGKDCSR